MKGLLFIATPRYQSSSIEVQVQLRYRQKVVQVQLESPNSLS